MINDTIESKNISFFSKTDLIVSSDPTTFDVENSIEVVTEDSQKEDDCDVASAMSNEQPAKGRKNHQKNHTCQYCGRAFPSSSLLSTHVRVSNCVPMKNYGFSKVKSISRSIPESGRSNAALVPNPLRHKVR